MKKVILAIAIILTATAAGFSQNTDTIVKHRLDSVIIIGEFKTVFFYDEHENEIRCVEYKCRKPIVNDCVVWQKLCKYEYAYDSNKNKITQTKEDVSYFNIKQLFKDEYAYDTNGNRTMWYEYRWDSINNNWEIFRKLEMEYVYDNNGKMIENIYYHFNDMLNIWSKYKTEYTYDIYGNKKNCITSRYLEKNIWEKDNKIEYTYDIYGNLIREVRSDYIENIWEEDYNTKYTYDSNRNQVEATHCSRDENYKIEHIYDKNQNLIRKIFYHLTNNTWEQAYKNEYVYDTSYPSENLIIPQYSYDCNYINNSNFMLIEERRYEWESNNWECNRIVKYYYSPQTK